MKYIFSLLFAWIPLLLTAQSLTGPELLDKTIAFHDPDNQWPTAQIQLNLQGERPDGTVSQLVVDIDLPNSYFVYEGKREEIMVRKGVQMDSCFASLDGRENLSEEEVKTYRADCASINRMRDYYVYLYGLPMKLKDPGTLIDPNVEKATFNGQEYLVLTVRYEPEVGAHTWLFYIHPETFAMEGYQFFKDETTREGEYIYLNGLVNVGGMKLPADRKWYYVPGDKYLGRDILESAN